MGKRITALKSKVKRFVKSVSGIEEGKKLSSPFATGSGGPLFENQIQTSFAVLMLAGGICPCLKRPIKEIKLQGRYAGFHTDDFIAFVEQADGSDKAKFLAQIKHAVSITIANTAFKEAIAAAWRDFKNPDVFDPTTDVIALISGPLSATDIDHVRPILESSRNSQTADEFFKKMKLARFTSSESRKKLKIFRTQLNIANQNIAITNDELWAFLRCYHLLGFDLDVQSGTSLSFLHSLIAQFNGGDPTLVWGAVTNYVASANQNAGTLTRDTIPKNIRDLFSKQKVQMPEELKTETNTQALSGDQGNAVMLATLLGSWNEKMDSDMDVAKKLIE